MVFKYGYVIGEQLGNLTATTGRIITPSHLPETITLSVTNSSRFQILGTKPEILEWLNDNSSIKVDVVLYDDAKEAPHIHIPDLIIDLLPYIDITGHEQHNNNLINLFLPTHHPDLNSEPVRLEIRPAVNLDNQQTQPYFRILLQRNCTLGDILKEAKEKWDNIILPSLWDNVKKVAMSPFDYVKEEENEDLKKKEQQNNDNYEDSNNYQTTITVEKKSNF